MMNHSLQWNHLIQVDINEYAEVWKTGSVGLRRATCCPSLLGDKRVPGVKSAMHVLLLPSQPEHTHTHTRAENNEQVAN